MADCWRRVRSYLNVGHSTAPIGWQLRAICGLAPARHGGNTSHDARWGGVSGTDAAALALQRRQLWLWGIGMLVMTLPWHWLGLNGQWRRVAHFDYSDPLIAWWGPWVVVSLIGGVILLASALLFVWNLANLHTRRAPLAASPIATRYALPLHPVERVPASLNGFALWNVLVLVLMLAAYGWPIAQFIVAPSPGAVVHHVDRAG